CGKVDICFVSKHLLHSSDWLTITQEKSCGIDDHYTSDGRKPQSPVACAPTSRLRTGIGFTALHPVGFAEDERFYCLDGSGGYGVQIMATEAKNALVRSDPQVAAESSRMLLIVLSGSPWSVVY